VPLRLNVPAARRRRILVLALPIIGGMVSQNVLNLVDTAMVGVLGDSAIAAVGMGGIMNFVTSALILGLGAGVQAMASRRVGEGRHAETAVPLNGGLVLGIAAAIPWAILLWFAVPSIFPLVVDDPAVVGQGVPYVRARFVAMAAMAMNYSFRGYWNATDRSALYMRTLVLMHAANIVLNWLLIYGNLGFPRLGATGAGVASAAATWLGTLYYFLLGIRHARAGGFLRGLPDATTLRTMVRVSLPAGLQQLSMAAGYMAFYAIAAMLGTAEVAATTVTVNLLLVARLPGMGLGFASSSLVGQALGRKDVSDARRWGWDVSKIGFLVVGAIAIPGVVVPELLLIVFLHDPDTLALAVGPLRLISVFMAFDAVGSVLMLSLMGAGDTRRVMLLSTGIQWLLYLPLAYLVGPVLGLGLTAVWLTNIGYRLALCLVFAVVWRGASWTTIRV